jgi:hypothetical protein
MVGFRTRINQDTARNTVNRACNDEHGFLRQKQNHVGESGGHVGRDCRKTARRRGVQWGARVPTPLDRGNRD